MVDWNDVEDTFGSTLTTAQRRQADLWVTFTRNIISARYGDLDLLDQSILDMVVCEAVANRLKRPDQAKQVSVMVDDAQISRTYETATGQIEILDAWWDLLDPSVSQSDAFSITPGHAW